MQKTLIQKDMKIGTVSQAAQDRSVLRPFQLAGVLQRPAGAGSVTAGEPYTFRQAGGTFTGLREPTLQMYMAQAVNAAASAGVRESTLRIAIWMPADTEEEMLRSWTSDAAAFAAAHNLAVSDCRAAVSDGLARPVISVTAGGGTVSAHGTVSEEAGCSSREEQRFLIMTGYTGYAGTAVLARLYEDALREHYPSFLVDAGLSFDRDILTVRAAGILTDAAEQIGTGTMCSVDEGGIFAALHRLSAAEGTGFDIGLKNIPIRQETVEISEFTGANPYQLYGTGAMLAVVNDHEKALALLHENGCPAAWLGRMTDDIARVIRNGEETRYLEKPQQDALYASVQ